GTVVEERQGHFRGGANEPLTRQDIEDKFMLNARHGGWNEARSKSALGMLRKLYDGRIDLSTLRGGCRSRLQVIPGQRFRRVPESQRADRAERASPPPWPSDRWPRPFPRSPACPGPRRPYREWRQSPHW